MHCCGPHTRDGVYAMSCIFMCRGLTHRAATMGMTKAEIRPASRTSAWYPPCLPCSVPECFGSTLHNFYAFETGSYPQTYRYPPVSLKRTRQDRECMIPKCARNISTRGMAHGVWLSQLDCRSGCEILGSNVSDEASVRRK